MSIGKISVPQFVIPEDPNDTDGAYEGRVERVKHVYEKVTEDIVDLMNMDERSGVDLALEGRKGFVRVENARVGNKTILEGEMRHQGTVDNVEYMEAKTEKGKGTERTEFRFDRNSQEQTFVLRDRYKEKMGVDKETVFKVKNGEVTEFGERLKGLPTLSGSTS
jgi:hypothetical protein